MTSQWQVMTSSSVAVGLVSSTLDPISAIIGFQSSESITNLHAAIVARRFAITKYASD